MHIESVSITVPHAARSAQFFREVLDLPVSGDEDVMQVQLGKSTLLLNSDDAVDNGYYHLAFDIPENSISTARDLLGSRAPVLPAGDRGIVTASGDWNAHSVYFNAPGNLNLELIARHRQQNAISRPFAFADIQSISEVGIPVENTLDATRKLKATFAADAFGEPSEAFAPVGDDNGLIILVRSRRTWFPTDDQVTTSRPIDMTIRGSSTVLELTPAATILGKTI